MRREFWQSHDCSGYRAKISIEWETPRNIEELAGDRDARTEEIASEALARLASKPLEIVQAMLGRMVPLGKITATVAGCRNIEFGHCCGNPASCSGPR